MFDVKPYYWRTIDNGFVGIEYTDLHMDGLGKVPADCAKLLVSLLDMPIISECGEFLNIRYHCIWASSSNPVVTLAFSVYYL